MFPNVRSGGRGGGFQESPGCLAVRGGSEEESAYGYGHGPPRSHFGGGARSSVVMVRDEWEMRLIKERIKQCSIAGCNIFYLPS